MRPASQSRNRFNRGRTVHAECSLGPCLEPCECPSVSHRHVRERFTYSIEVCAPPRIIADNHPPAALVGSGRLDLVKSAIQNGTPDSARSTALHLPKAPPRDATSKCSLFLPLSLVMCPCCYLSVCFATPVHARSGDGNRMMTSNRNSKMPHLPWRLVSHYHVQPDLRLLAIRSDPSLDHGQKNQVPEGAVYNPLFHICMWSTVAACALWLAC